jgi:hypothetical protein
MTLLLKPYLNTITKRGNLPLFFDQSLQERRKSSAVQEIKRHEVGVVMILPQVHLRKPCYDFTFL